MAIKITKNGTAGAQDRAPAAKTYQEGSSQGKASGRIKITKIERPQTAAKQKWTVGNIGQYGAGNIDLYDRPQYRNANGSISTVDSTSYNIDGQEVLLPTVWNRNGTPYHSSNDEEILQRYRDTGEYLGKFSTVEEANDYAEKLHLEQQERYPSSSLPAERGSKHKSGKEISQSIVRNEDAAKRIGATVRATAQNLGANASGFLAALVAAAEEMDKEYRDAKEKAGVTTHADEMNPYPKTNEEITRGNRAGIDLLEGIADTQRAKAAENIRTAKEGLGTAGRVGIDAFQIGMNLAGIVGANAILPGLGTAALGVSSGGSMANDYRQAQGENYNPLAGAGLAIGGAASVGVGGAAAKGAIRYGGALLNKLGLGNSAIAQNVLGALSDIAFAGGMSATNEYAKAAAYGDSYEDVAISGEELAKDMLFQAAVGFFCRTLASSLGGKAEGATAQKAQREYFKDIDNLDDLTKAFKQYGRQYHPDRFATADAATQREMNDLFAKISAEYNAVKAELAVETAGRAAKAYSEQRTAKTPEAAQKAQATVKDEIAVMRSLVESGAIQAKEAVEAVQILDALAGEQTAGKPENPTADTAPERAAGTSENAPMPTSEEIGNQQTAQNSSPAQGADHSRQRVGGTVAPLGVSATQESKVSITPVGGKSKNNPLTQGKRVSLLQYANEGNVAEISERLNRGELAVDANGDLYRPKAEEHIDQRDSKTVGERRINAFQFDHPEVHSFYKEAAADLMEELNYAEKGGGIVKLKEHGAGDDQYIRMKRSASERIAKLLDDEGISYADIERSISAIINDKGQENFAAAKRVELMLDNMLSNGYRDVHGGYHEPNADYLEAKQAIPGASETAATHEELPLWDIEEKNGGTTHGTEIKPAEPAEEGGADAVGAQSDLHGGDGGRRPYGDGAGGAAQLRQQPKSGSIERLHENVRRNRARTGGERSKENGALIQARQAAAALEPLVSSAEVGVSLGTDTKMLHILPRNAWDQELLDVEAAAKQAGISEVVMVTGLLQVNGGGSPVSITGVAERETNRIVMRVDSRKKTASELGLHEIAHFRSTRENVEAFAAAVQDSGDGWRDTLEEYRERYKGAANNYEGMTPEDADLYVWEEIMGDAYAGIDCFGQTASQYHTEAVRAIDGGSGAIPAQEAQRASSAIQKETSAASERKTGPPARFSYAGRNANGANLERLREAQEMQAAGADMESIRKATGWHEGMDGKWRWEIDDSKMEYHRAGDALFGRNHPEYAEQQRLEQKMLYGELTDTEQARLRALTETWGRERNRLSERVERGNARLEDVLDHEELFRAYPQLRHVRVVFDETPKGVLGSFSAEGNQITISEELRDAPQDVLIHEIQHAIQNAEGFAKGSNRQYWEEKLTNGDEIQSKGFQEAREKLIQFQLDEANEEVLALRDQLEKAGELDDGFREYDRIWEEAERRGLDKKINEYYDLRENYYDQLHKPQRSVPSELYYNTAGEIEARDAANRRPMSSETRKRIKPDYGNGDTVFANGEDSYSVGETDDGRAVAVVDNDILSHIDTSTWDSAKKAQAKAAAKTALLAFEDGIQVNGITYKVNRTSRREYTRSEDTERLARRTPDAFADKMRAADIADDIITATTSWAKDGKLKHPRRDSFVDFTHGDVLIQAGANQYDAETVVGITADGEYVFYDVVDMTPTSFTTKKEPSPTAAGNNASSDIQESSSERSISRSTEKSNREISGVQPLSLPTLEPTTKTRFSLDEPVEETETLVAMHNMTEEKLRRTLDIGAWPSPSIAVVKAKEGHANYGEYSAVFPRGTIDPQADSKNKVYGGDAWTPTHDNAIVERGVNYEARRAFDENIKNLSSRFADGVFQGSGTLGKIGLENDTRWEPEEIADKLANHPEVQAAFLQSEGKSLEPVYRDKQFDRFFSNATIRRYLDTVGEQEVARLAVKLMTGERLTAEEMKPAEQAIREVYAEEHANFLNRRPESKEKRIDYYMKNNVFPNRVEDFIRSTQEFYESGGSAGEIDKEATAAKMFELIAPSGSWSDALRTVKDWVKPQLEGLLGERGIYNGKDAVTDRGRRSFAETHWDYTAENIVKAMNMAAAKGANVYGITPETLAATATQEYKTVDEMHADEARLRTVSEEEHAKALRDLGIYLDRVTDDLLRTTKHQFDNTFEEEQNLSRIIAEAAKGKKTAAAVKAAFRKEGYAISDGHAKSILALIDRAANIPTGYYEAKAQRVVLFSEAAAIIAPTSAPAEEIAAVKAATGVNIIQYETGNDEQRKALVNGLEGVKFSISEDSNGRQLTEAQQEFFKDSKAVDGEGRLLTLYHGTGTKFTVFDKAHIGENFADRGSDLGFYFSPYIEDATGYAREATGYKGKGEIMQVYLNLKNPLVIEDEGWGSAIGQADIRHGDLKRWAQEGGHDGIIVKSTDIEMDDNGTPDAVYIAFSPEQIKSVTNENPTDNPDIRFSISEGGEYDGAVKLKESTIDTYLRDYAAKSSPKYAKAYIAYMTPDDFLNLTTSEGGRQIVEQHSKELDAEKLGEATRWQPIQLNIDHETGKVQGHEGRHRAVAMRNAGVEQIPVLLFDSSNKYSKSEIGELTLTGQDFGGTWSDAEVRVHNLLPLSYENRDAVVERFTMPTDERTLQYSVTEEETAEATLPTAEDEEKKNSIRTSLPKKAQDYLKRAENALVGRVSRALSVPRFAQREYLQKIAQQISEEYLTTGRVSEETAAELFEQAYSEGIVVDEEFYQQYKDIKDHLRTQAVTISEEDKHDIADFNDFRKSAFGRLRIVNEGGLPVDVAYQELQDMAPELFPDDLTHPADQLVRMFEVAQSIEKTEKSLSEYYGRDAEEFKRWAKNDFDAAIGDTIGDLRTVKRYADERAAKANATAETPMTTEQVTEAYKQLKKARWESEKAKAKNLLTDHDNVQLGRLLKGEIELEHLDPKTDNVKGITAVYEATTEYERLVKLLTEYKQSQRAKLREEADKFLETANDWKDKKAGILYSRETMERNILDIVKDKKLAQEIIAEYFTPVHEAQAKSTRLKNKMRERVQALNLSTKETKAMQKVGKISEAHAVQLLGEAMDNIRMLENSRGRMAERDGKTLSDWRGIVQEMWKQNPQLDKAKIEHAVEEFRSIYDELFQQMNEARVRNGYEPVNYRSGYFPHFQPGDGDGIMGLFGRALGIDTQVTALPTTINGLTHTFRPGIQWFGNAQQRLGFDTAYDAVEGFDRYIEGVADVIYQTDNIQKLRALATQARYRTGDEGIRKQVDTVYADTRLTEEEKRSKIDSIYEDGRFALSNFVVELEEYTNLLANKKSRADRNMEQALGRNMYNLVKGLESRVAANMVAINPASWLTNFIPLTQGGAMLDRGELLRGMWQTLQSFKENDGIVDASAFLTNRKGSDPLVRTWAQKASATMSSPMEYIDQFTAGSLVRARYNQNLKRGMSETAAMTEADNWTAGVMADRSKGSTPTLFNRSNPMTKVFTQFQLEVNNQLSYLFKDMPRAYKEKGLAVLAMALFKFFLGAWLYDEVYEYFIGRRPALDPLGILNDTVGDITGYELPNLVELGVGAVTGDMPSFETEKKNAYDTVTETLGDVAEELPFIGGVLGGGRVPISSALPDWDNLLKTVTSDTWSTKKKLATAGKELMNPLTYLALPFGGGQLKKIYQGLSATIKGGSYSVDAEGNDLLQYPVYNDDPWQAALNAGQAMLFGKTSLKTGRDWVESGFKSFGAKETAAYQGMTEAGVPEEDAYNLLKELRGTKKTETESKAEAERRVLQAADISGDGKSVVYYGLMATDKERELMDALADSDADMGAVTQVLLDVKNAGSLKGAEASNAKRTALAESPLTDDEKREMYRCLFGEKQEDGSYTTSRDDDIMEFEQAGLDFDTFLKVQNEYTTVNEKYSGASEKAVEFSRWVNSQNLAAEQAETVRDCFKYYSQIPAEAARYDSFVSAGLSDDAAYELANSLNALEPEDGKDSVSGLQRYRAVVDAGLSTEEQMNVLGEMMQESEYSKLQTGYSYGVTPEAYVAFRELLPKFDFDGNGTFKQEEVEAAIDSMGGGGNGIVLPGAGGGQSLTVTQQAALWQLANKSWKPAKNPYSTSVGQKVYDALNAETESGIVLPDGTSYTGGLVLPKG